MRTSDFLASLGVCTHLQYSDGAYANHDRTLGLLSYLGIKNVRDGAPKGLPNRPPYAKYTAAGVRWSINTRPEGKAVTDASAVGEVLDRIAGKIDPASIDYIEGPNEPNNWPIKFGGDQDTKTEHSACIAYCTALWAAMKARPDFSSIRTASASYNGLGGGDFRNSHPYPKNGAQPGPIMAKMTSKVVITEFGYNTCRDPKWWSGFVDERTQAILTINGLLDAFAAGVRRSYLYELIDQKPDPDGQNGENHWGLFRNNGTPKPVATALHNLTSILRDDPAVAASNITVTVSGLPATGRHMVLSATRRAYVVFWNEPDIWNETAAKPTPVTPVKVRVKFPKASYNVYSPLDGAGIVRSATGQSTTEITISDAPKILELIYT